MTVNDSTEAPQPVANQQWGGRFSEGVDAFVQAFTASVNFDQRLYQHDIAGSVAHATMLAQVGVLTDDERDTILDGLAQVKAEIENGQFEWSVPLEDVHMNIEQALTKRVPAAAKLHTARSRNDQVATDMRLFFKHATGEIEQSLTTLIGTLLDLAETNQEVYIPGYTHLQRAQPVLASHYWLAYCEKLQRDRERIADCRKRVNISSLGCAAMAGTSLDIDRELTAKKLGFQEVARNSLDVSSDRDFVLESAFVLSNIAIHLSGWAEEWILWSTTEFDFIELPQQFCTGSSIMPQKINPDILELIRGKTARVVGNLQSLLMLVKGLPLAYNRDLQEDKPALFDSFDTVSACLELAIPLVQESKLKNDSIQSRLENGYLDATTLMEFLIKRGVPQRAAHHKIGELVNRAMQQGIPLAKLPLSAFQEVDSSLDASVFDVLGVENAVQSFVSYGSTSPKQVANQVTFWRKKVGISL